MEGAPRQSQDGPFHTSTRIGTQMPQSPPLTVGGGILMRSYINTKT